MALLAHNSGHSKIYKVTPDIDFTGEVLVQCYVPVMFHTFVGAGNLQVVTKTILIRNLMGALCTVSWSRFVYIVSPEVGTYNLRSWF